VTGTSATTSFTASKSSVSPGQRILTGPCPRVRGVHVFDGDVGVDAEETDEAYRVSRLLSLVEDAVGLHLAGRQSDRRTARVEPSATVGAGHEQDDADAQPALGTKLLLVGTIGQSSLRNRKWVSVSAFRP
jgi:hypothetical protein